MEQRRVAEAGADYGKLRRGWCLGGERFRKELLAEMGEPSGSGALRSGTWQKRDANGRTGHCHGIEEGAVDVGRFAGEA